LQVWSPEFKPQSHKKQNKKTHIKMLLCFISLLINKMQIKITMTYSQLALQNLKINNTRC
jgi:hypothetical protein